MDDYGLMFYTARWYDLTLGRFIQADTMVPGGVQGYDRYAYVNNDPVLYNDPTGHDYCDRVNNNNAEDCNGGESRIAKSDNMQQLRKQHDNDAHARSRGPLISALRPGPACTETACVQPSGICPIGANCIGSSDAIWPSHMVFSWAAVDWFDVGINVAGIGGDAALVSTVGGDVAGPELWLLSEGAEVLGTMHAADKADTYGLTTSASSQVVKVLGEIHETPDLIPIAGAYFNLGNIGMDFLNATVQVPNYTSP